MLSVLRAISMDNTEQMEEMEDSEEGEEEIFEQSTKWEAFLGCVLDIFFICLFPISAWWCFKTVQVCHFKSFNTVYSTLRAPNLKVSFFPDPRSCRMVPFWQNWRCPRPGGHLSQPIGGPNEVHWPSTSNIFTTSSLWAKPNWMDRGNQITVQILHYNGRKKSDRRHKLQVQVNFDIQLLFF